MAQFDVQWLASKEGLVVDCQSELLEHLNTRFVVPVMPRDHAPAPAQRLNPIFVINGREHVMATQFAAAIHKQELGEVVTSLRDHSFEIVGALDVMISGV